MELKEKLRQILKERYGMENDAEIIKEAGALQERWQHSHLQHWKVEPMLYLVQGMRVFLISSISQKRCVSTVCVFRAQTALYRQHFLPRSDISVRVSAGNARR